MKKQNASVAPSAAHLFPPSFSELLLALTTDDKKG